jgi:hypothetical protein
MSDFDDRIRDLLPPVTPLSPPPETFARITRTARKRKRLRLVSSTAASAAVVVALGFVVRTAWPPTAATSAGHNPACTTADLRLSVADGSIAGATVIGREVVLTNQGPRACELSGYPTVRLLSSTDNSPLALARTGGTKLWRDPGNHPLPLNPGAAAVFGVEWTPSDAKCSDSTSSIGALQAAAPGQPPLPAVTLPDAGCLQAGLAVTALVAASTGLTPAG